MTISSLLKDNVFGIDKPSISVLLETDNTKEVKILLQKGQVMKRHQAPFPIIIEIFEGSIRFGTDEQSQTLVKGDLISLKSNVPHDLTAVQDSIVRLSLSKGDKVDRVKQAAD